MDLVQGLLGFNTRTEIKFFGKVTVERERIGRLSLGLWHNLGQKILILALIFPGCTHTPLRVEDIVMAETMVVSAVEAEAEKFAPKEIKQARENIGDTQRAIEKGNYQEAHRLTDEAILLATLAEARAREKSAEERLKDLKDKVKQLQRDVVEAEANLERTKEQLFRQF